MSLIRIKSNLNSELTEKEVENSRQNFLDKIKIAILIFHERSGSTLMRLGVRIFSESTAYVAGRAEARRE